MLGIVDPQIFSTLFGDLLAQNFERVKESMGALQEYESEMILDEMMLFLKDRQLPEWLAVSMVVQAARCERCEPDDWEAQQVRRL